MTIESISHGQRKTIVSSRKQAGKAAYLHGEEQNWVVMKILVPDELET